MSDEEARVHWFVRQGKRNKFFALMNPDGSASTEVISLDCFMFWHMSEQKSERSFSLSNYWLKIIDCEYREIDRREQM